MAKLEALAQRFGDGPAQLFGQVVDVLGDGYVGGVATAQLAGYLRTGLGRLLEQRPSGVCEMIRVLVGVRKDAGRRHRYPSSCAAGPEASFARPAGLA